LTENTLVTGATGFIGQHLVEVLVEKGSSVTCLVRSTSQISRLQPLGISFIEGDITDKQCLPQALTGINTVFHLAGLLEARPRSKLYEVNEVGTRNLTQACAACQKPPVLVILSSLEAAGSSPDDAPRTESEPSTPITTYGKSKLAGEHAAVEHADEVPISIVRAPIVIGEWDRQSLNVFKLLRLARFGINPLPLRRTMRLSLIHAHDLAEFLLMVADRGERLASPMNAQDDSGQGLYYVAYDEHPTFAELLRMASTTLGESQVRVIHIPQVFLLVLALPYEAWYRVRGGSPGVINLDKARAAFAGSWTCSPEKARIQLGFKPSLPLIDRIQQTVNWYQDQGWL
jgi:dihydroflavonol-4-reductase